MTTRRNPRLARAISSAATLTLLGAAAVSAAAPSRAATVNVVTAPTVIINEVNAVNFSGATDEAGKRGDWVELFNTTAATVDLSGWGLSSTAKSPFRWVFPAGTTISARGYLRVWLDKADRTASTANLHTNFNIDNGVDPVVLSAPNGTVLGQLVDSATPPRTRPDVSWCRMPSGLPSSPFASCLTPTPAAANSGTTATGLLSTPTLSVRSGVYAAAQTVTATAGAAAIDAGAVLRYTTDGSEPTATSALVAGPIAVTTSTTLRVGAFKAGAVPSFAATATYVIDGGGRYAGQRVMFVTMRPADRNAYVGGSRASAPGWKSYVEMLAPDGAKAFAGDAQTEDAGQLGSRNGQQTFPLEVNFKDATGLKDVSYPIFSGKPGVTKFKKLRLRNAGDDYQEAHLRDQYWQVSGTEAGLAAAEYEPVQLFVNGAYYGMMDLREKEDETLAESTFGVDKDDVQFLSDSRVVAGEGTAASWRSTYSFITGNSMATPANYAQATNLIDVEDFAHDFALHMFAIDRDWQWRNMHYFRMPSYDGKWRYRPHDFDISSDGTDAWGFRPATSTNMNDKYVGHESGAVMRALLANPDFKRLYANVIADQLNTALKPSDSVARLDEMAGRMQPYVANQIAKNGQPTSITKWQSEVERLRTFLREREQYYVSHTQSYLGLTGRAPLTVGVDDSARGTVKVNTVDLTSRMTGVGATWTGSYWTTVPVTLTAQPKLGFAFTGWSDGVTTRTRTVNAGSATTFRATFAPVISPTVTAVPAPAVTAIAARTDATGTVVSVQAAGSDPTGYPLTWSAKSLPNGLDIHPVTGLIYGKPTRGGVFAATVTASNGSTKTTVPVTWTVTNRLDRTVVLPTTIGGTGTGLTAVWTDAAGSTRPTVTRVEAPAVALSASTLPFTGWKSSGWSVRWTGMITAPSTGRYTFRATVNSDDSVRMSVNGVPVLDAWNSTATTPSGSVDLVAGRPTPVTIEFRDDSGAANLGLAWQVPGRTDFVPVVAGVLDPA